MILSKIYLQHLTIWYDRSMCPEVDVAIPYFDRCVFLNLDLCVCVCFFVVVVVFVKENLPKCRYSKCYYFRAISIYVKWFSDVLESSEIQDVGT